MALRFGIYVVPNKPWPELEARWSLMEDLGFDSVWGCDVLYLPEAPGRICFDGLVILATMAARTNRVRVGTLMLSLPIRDNPAVLAKEIIALDHLSSGRIEFGFGGGILEGDHTGAGHEFWSKDERIARFREAVQIIDLALREEVVTVSGRYYRTTGLRISPGPVQRPRPPLVIAAHSAGSLLDNVPVEMGILDETQDAFGRALLDHQRGRNGPLLMLEGDDGSIRPADLQPEEFFLPFEEWAPWEQQLIDTAAGAVLDLGAGAGRHAIYLQNLGHDVTAVDVSPGAVQVCRARGIHDVRTADLREFSIDGRWDTVLLMCGNLGLAGDWEPTRILLKRLAGMASEQGLLIGDSVDPTSHDPDDLAYENRNQQAGFHRGHVRLRLHYGDLVTPWWDQINLPPEELEELIKGTGWSLIEILGDAEGYGVVLRRH
jgi:SAM-dependent methyltransferase